MARPRKHPDEIRSQVARARLTLAEHEYVKHQAAIAGLEPAEYIRRRILDYEVPAQLHERVDPTLVTEINRLGLQLAAIGNNANQLARAANAGRPERVAWQDVVQRINQLTEDVASALDKTVIVADVNQLGIDLSSIRSNARKLAQAAEDGAPAQVAWQQVVVDISTLGTPITEALERLVPSAS